MDWKRFLEDLSRLRPASDYKSGLHFYAPVSNEQISNLGFPDSLSELLQQTNGVMQWMEINGEPKDIQWLIWPLEKIAETAHTTDPGEQSYYGLQDDRLFFADIGVDGISFAFLMNKNPSNNPPICVWYPMEERFEFVADTLEELLKRWLDGTLKI